MATAQAGGKEEELRLASHGDEESIVLYGRRLLGTERYVLPSPDVDEVHSFNATKNCSKSGLRYLTKDVTHFVVIFNAFCYFPFKSLLFFLLTSFVRCGKSPPFETPML